MPSRPLLVTGLMMFVSVMSLTGCLRVCPKAIGREAGEPSTGKRTERAGISLREWERGIVVQSSTHENVFLYLWFYEWHMFDAVLKGEHTRGSFDWLWNVSADRTIAVMKSPAMDLTVQATPDGADLTLTITNTSGRDWPEIAAIIPCFNPGNETKRVEVNPLFLDEAHTNTYFLGPAGLELFKEREIHFNAELRASIDRQSSNGEFVFSAKWPTSERNAVAGLIIRESDDKRWVGGIAWDDFLSAQGHNPWKCMHLSIRVGPLKQGESRTIRGKMFLFQGTKEDCLERFESSSMGAR